MIMTEHAKIRCKQRGIKPDWLELIVQFGKKGVLPGGATGYFLTRQECKRIAQTLDRLKGIQVIESPDGAIITTYHRS